MAKVKASGSSKNSKDSAGRRLGFKVFPSQFVKAGAIVIRQRGTKWFSSFGTVLGRDHTINATVSGVVCSSYKNGRKYLSVR